MLDRKPDGSLVALQGDFGSEKDFKESMDYERNMTRGSEFFTHMSAKQLFRTDHEIDEADDMWAFGCTCLEVGNF